MYPDDILEPFPDSYPPEPLVDDNVASDDSLVNNEEIIEQPQFSDEDIKKAFESLLMDARNEDRYTRDNYIYLWKRLDYYFNNILDIFFDPVARDWRVPNWDDYKDEIPPRLINIFRPHAEAIVAALSVTIPTVTYYPDDADNPDDIEAANAYKAITELLEKHNDAAMLFIRAIVVMFNQGTIFGYNYYHKDPKFGMIKKARIEPTDVNTYEIECPECGYPVDAGIGKFPVSPENSNIQCEQCGYSGPGNINESLEKLPQIVGFDETPKGSICQTIFSGLQVKVPAYVKKQEECGYLLLEFVQSVPLLRSVFKDKADQIDSQFSTADNQFSKIPPQYYSQVPENAANVSCLWLRPYQFWQLGVGKKDLIEYLATQYPDGVYALFVNDIYFEAYPENMDEHWTISENPMGEFIYSRPLGENLATVQDIRANLVEIEIQTAEHGIPETFVDPKVLDFDKYGKGQARPGMITKATPRSGKSLNDAFFTTQTATLSQEIDPLRQHIDQDAQFVTGSFPSVYGGPATGGSKTASEYAQSKATALQRLGTFWKILSHFWSRFQSRGATEYANVLRELNQDEKFVKKNGQGFINVWIRAASLSGKVGHAEPESTEQLPVSWAQKKDAIFQLIQNGTPEILAVLTHPNNASLVKSAVGLSELYIPGEEDRVRQFKEFFMLSQGIPVPVNEFDNDEIHLTVLDSILEGPLGEQLEQNVMQICLQHRMEHEMKVAQQMQQMVEQQRASVDNAGKPQPEKKPKEQVK